MQKPNSLIIANNKPTKRRNTSPELRQSHVSQWRKSGLSMSEYCRQQNLAISSFSAWASPAGKTKLEFNPMIIKAQTTEPKRRINCVEIVVDERIKVRLLDISDMSMIVNLIRGIAQCNS
jgi:transposase-like protein